MNQDLIYLDDQLQDKQLELENDDTDEDLVPQNKIQAIKFEYTLKTTANFINMLNV